MIRPVLYLAYKAMRGGTIDFAEEMGQIWSAAPPFPSQLHMKQGKRLQKMDKEGR